MGYHSDWTGKAVVAVVIAVMVTLAATFALGVTTSEQLQWLHPEIAKAIAAFKAQQARNQQLLNDKLQEEINARRIENSKHQHLAQIEVENARQWSRLWPRLVEMFVSAAADVIRLGGVGFALLMGYIVYRRYSSDRVSPPARMQRPALKFRPVVATSRTFDFQVAPPRDDEASENILIMRLETPAEKERYRFLRERGRRREAERRRVLMTAPYDQGGDAII